jgi:hypothetical protein
MGMLRMPVKTMACNGHIKNKRKLLNLIKNYQLFG